MSAWRSVDRWGGLAVDDVLRAAGGAVEQVLEWSGFRSRRRWRCRWWAFVEGDLTAFEDVQK
eukprot:158580-Pyramimonas_sp.AAC.1